MTRFGQVVVCDFEYETCGGVFQLVDGDLPKVLCMVAYILTGNLEHVRTIRLWRGEFGREPPFDIGNDTLFCAYAAWAELTIFLTLGWKFPKHVFDLHTAYLASSNILLPYNPDEKRKKQRKRLSDACRAYGVDGWENIDKEEIAAAIGNGRWQEYGRERVFAYCEEDVRASALLLQKQLRGHGRFEPVDTERVIFFSDYSSKAIARIQSRGIPIDLPLWEIMRDNAAAIVSELIRRFDPSYGSENQIYSPDGEWSYWRFERWLVDTGVLLWPRLESGQLDISSDAFDLMSHVPGATGLHALRKSVGFIKRAKLPIGRDGRNRPSLFPFGTATGRNAHAKSIFNAHAGMRSLIVYPSNTIGVYLDWKTQEVGCAAALSGDQTLMDDYRNDVYHALALMCGLTEERNAQIWKAQYPDMRQRMKSLQLAISYGMGVPSLARGLDRHPLIASEIIERHKRRYPRFWQWRADTVQAAMLDRQIESVYGWTLYLSSSPNRRTLYNFPMQSSGADMLRLAACRLCDAGLVPNMTAHDAVLLEVNNEEQIEHAKEIMSQAGCDVLAGFKIGVDADPPLENGARYQDKRDVAREMWSTIMSTLQDLGALLKEKVA
jgi:DNA polymerase-1